MTATAEKRKPGNPALTKKEPDVMDKKIYRFQLLKSYDSAKPVDAKTGEPSQNPFPPIHIVPNEGRAYNPVRKEIEHWRYLNDYQSIWVIDQEKPKPTKAQLDSHKNTIQFNEGMLTVSGKEKAKIQALMVQDIFEEVKDPIEQVTKIYQLLDQYKEMSKVRAADDQAYEAEKAAREAGTSELLPMAMLFGININDPESNEEIIRGQLIRKARTNPKFFLEQFANPKNRIKFLVTKAIQEGVISYSMIPGKMVMAETGVPLFSVNSEGDVPDQVASLVMSENEAATRLVDGLERRF